MFTLTLTADKALEIAATGETDIKCLIDVHGSEELQGDIFAIVKIIESGSHTELVHKTSCNNLYDWFRLEGTIYKKFAQPYLSQLERITGYTLTDNDRILIADQLLKHTHYCESIYLTNNGLEYVVYDSACHWNNKTPQENAKNYGLKYATEDISGIYIEPEYTPVGKYGDTYRLNPNRKIYSIPKLQEKPWHMLFNWWLSNKANTAQRIAVAQNRQLASYLHISSTTASVFFLTNQETKSSDYLASLA